MFKYSVSLFFLLLSTTTFAIESRHTPKGFRAPLPTISLEKEAALLCRCCDLQDVERFGLCEYFENTLVSNEKNGDFLVLENASEWSFNWFWSMKTKNWKPGDQIVISHHPDNFILPCVRAENISRGSTAWCELHREPSISSSATVWIEDIQCGSLLFLNNGLRIDTQAAGWIEYFGWEKNDVVLFMPHPGDKTRYDIWNFAKNSIIADLPLTGVFLENTYLAS